MHSSYCLLCPSRQHLQLLSICQQVAQTTQRDVQVDYLGVKRMSLLLCVTETLLPLDGKSQLPSTRILFLPAHLFFFFFFRAIPAAYGGSQARSQIRAVAAGLCHSNVGSELHLRPTPQLMAMSDP